MGRGGRGVAGLRYVFYTPHVRIANAEVIADKQCTEDGRQALAKWWFHC